MPEITKKLTELHELRASSAALMEGLTREGVGQVDMGGGRLEMFIEAVLPWAEGTNEARLDFELQWEAAANRALTELAQQVRTQKLTQGVSLVPPSPPNGQGHGLIR